MAEPPDELIAGAQEALLAAVLTGRPLSETGSGVTLPDLQFVLGRSAVVVSDRNLSPQFRLERVPTPVQVLSEEEIAELAAREGEVGFVQFQPPTVDDDETVRLTVELRLLSPDRGAAGLSGARVALRRVDDEWRFVEEPALFAA